MAMSDRKPPRMIFFDAAYTLIRPEPTVGSVYAREAAKFSIKADATMLDRAFRMAWRAARDRHEVKAPGTPPYGRTEEEARRFWYGVIVESFAFGGVHLPPDSPFLAHLFNAFEECGCWHLYDDVHAALNVCHEAGVAAGVLSNFDARLHRILANFGVAPRFQFIVASSDAGAEKPSPAIYRHAQALAGEGTRCAMIGDELEADGTGAVRAGWAQCLIARDEPFGACGLKSARTLPDAVRTILDAWK